MVHDELRKFIVDDDPADFVSTDAIRLRRIVSFLQDMAGVYEADGIPDWGLWSPKKDSAERRSVLVAGRRHLTFRIDNDQAEIIDLDWVESR